MSKDWRPYARHILDAIEKIRRIEARGALSRDDVLYDAALRNLQTLSEATQLLPEDKKAQYPRIPWRQISGFRNILVHNYLGEIDALTVEAVIQQYLSPLEECIQVGSGAAVIRRKIPFRPLVSRRVTKQCRSVTSCAITPPCRLKVKRHAL